MIFGILIQPVHMEIAGLVLFVFLLWQLLTGLRVIKLPPHVRTKVHKSTGVTLFVLAALHGLAGFALFNGWRIL